MGEAKRHLALATDAVKEKRDAYRAKALLSDDAVFDAERGLFMIHGKHPTLAGIEAVIALDLPSFLSMFHGVIPVVLIPMLQAFAKQNPPKTVT